MPLAPPPRLPLSVIRDFVSEKYGMAGEFTALDGERDQNHRLAADSGNVVVKVGSAGEPFVLAQEQARALDHLATVAPSLPVPRCVASRDGSKVSVLRCDDADHPVLVLQWLDGEVAGERHLSAEQYLAWGAVIGQLNKAMRGFVSVPLMLRQLDWNVASFDEVRWPVSELSAGEAALLTPVLHSFRQSIAPRLKRFPHQVMHCDVHPYNTLFARDGGVSGIIDFGDMIFGPRLLDLSNAIGDCLVPGHDMARVVENLVSGFVRHVPLEAAEVGVLLPLAKMRTALSFLISRQRMAQDVTLTPQISALAALSLDVLRALERKDLTEAVRYAANVPRQSSPSESHLQERRASAMGRKSLLFYDTPLQVVNGEGVWLTAADGRQYLDCYNNVPHVGHAHPHVADAVARQLRVLNTNTRYLTEEAVAYAERLKATLHPSLDTVVFVNSGSEANDVAWRMANVFTGHTGALCMDFAYHGVTMASDMLSPSNYPPGGWRAPLVRQLRAPDVYRDPLNVPPEEAGEAYAAAVDALLSSLDREGHGISIAIMDSAFMTNGILEAPAGYVSAVMRRVHDHGGLFIADEVQSGFGRMGTHMWGHQHHGIIPDFVTIGKPAGNGYPVGAIITRSAIMDRFVDAAGPFFSTFGGGNAACAAGIAVLEVMDHEDLQSNSLSTGQYLRQQLRGLMGRHDLIGDVRGSGLATGVELVSDRTHRTPAPRATREVINGLKDAGVLVGSDGKWGNVLKIRPPLVFSTKHADRVVDTLDRVLAVVGRTCEPARNRL